jgi:uroporphyrinogen-III decarboxylase
VVDFDLILASNSPRRRELLALTGWKFQVHPAEVDEVQITDEKPGHYVLRLAKAKAQACAGSAHMVENPATPFERVLQTWGKAGRGFIGGISTAILTNGTPEEVSRHTREVITRRREYPGFIISSCGGLPGTIPMDNMLAYLRTRSELGCFADLA